MIARKLLLAIAALALAACSRGLRDSAELPSPIPEPRMATATQPGTIFVDGFELFADLRARSVGDILTINLVEQMNAENESSSNASKGSSVDTGFPVIGGGPITYDGAEILNNEIEGSRTFGGQTDSSQSNRIRGTITVTVVERFSNGNLLVEGEKWIAINHGEELIKVSGVVRPVDIARDNSVLSTQVANARIDYHGIGTLADSNRPGWLTRFFNSPWFPF